MLTLEDVTGGPETIRSAVGMDPRWSQARFKTTKLFTDLALEIARLTCYEHARELVTVPLSEMLVAFIDRNGQRPAVDGTEQQEWDSAIDDEVAGIFEQYQANLSASWLGEKTVDTLLHQPGEIQKLADSFAKELWSQLTYHRTTNQIMAGLGLTPDIAAETLNASTQESTVQAPNINAVLNKIMLAMPDENTLIEELDSASDNDDVLASGAAERLGIDMSEALVLRLARAAGADPEDWAQVIVAGELLVMPAPSPPTVASPPVVETVTGGPDGGARTTVPPPPVAAQGGSGRVPPPPVGRSTVPLPPPATPAPAGRRRKEAATPPHNAMPAELLLAVKAATGLKDNELADIFGVSRPTFNNYLKGKQFVVPSPELRKTLLDRIEGLSAALVKAVAYLK